MVQKLPQSAMILPFPLPPRTEREPASDAEIMFLSRNIAIELVKVMVRSEHAFTAADYRYLQQLNALFWRYGYPPLRYDS